MISALKKTNLFLLMSAMMIAIGFALLFFSDKIESHLYVNASHTEFQDFIFTWITYAGDGGVLAVASVILVALFWKKYSYSVLTFAALNLLFVATAVQILKRVIYYDAFRPVKFIGEEFLYLVPGIDVHSDHSFPSGHTTTAFAFFAFVALLWHKNKWVQIGAAMIAILAGYSRIYLSQHFLEDVVAGSTIGIGCFLLTYLIVGLIPFNKNIAR